LYLSLLYRPEEGIEKRSRFFVLDVGCMWINWWLFGVGVTLAPPFGVIVYSDVDGIWDV
jgi:hypothetical protein